MEGDQFVANKTTAAPTASPNSDIADDEVINAGADVSTMSNTQASKILQHLNDIQLQLELVAPGDSHSSAAAQTTDAITERLESLRGEVQSLSETLQTQLADAVEQLSASQSAATTSQSEIIRTLTEVIFTSSSSGGNTDQLESLFSEFESRISSQILAALTNKQIKEKQGGTTQQAEARQCIEPETPESSEESSAALTESGEQTWEDIRRSLMNGTADDRSAATKSEVSTTASSGFGSTSVSNAQAFSLPDTDLTLDIPELIDIDALDITQLREALKQRERLICSIIGRLRRQSYSSTDTMTTEQLRTLMTDMPAEFATRVNHTLQRIDEQLRLGELELSLERARLSRQASQLDYARAQVEHNARQLGYTINPDGTLSSDATAMPRTSSSRRWLGKLGFSE